MSVTYGLQTPQRWSFAEASERWRRFEELGFDSLWMPDHLVAPFRRDAPLYEAWTMLAALATVTSRARIGILVSCNTFRHPAVLAKQAVTVDHLSGGRLNFGLGGGWFAEEHDWFGITLPGNRELVERYREAVTVCDRLMREDVASFDGRYYQLRAAPTQPRPVQRPRPKFALGAHGPKMLGIVAEYGDIWNSLGTVPEMRERNHRLDEACAVIGRNPGEIVRSLLYVPAQMPEEDPWASVEAFRDFVGRYQEVGVGDFLFQPPPNDNLAPVESIAAQVLGR